MSDDGDPLTSDEDDNAETFDSAFAPLAGAQEKEGDHDAASAAEAAESSKEDATSTAAAASTTATTASSSGASAAKKPREKKSGSESGDGKTVSSPRLAHGSVSIEHYFFAVSILLSMSAH